MLFLKSYDFVSDNMSDDIELLQSITSFNSIYTAKPFFLNDSGGIKFNLVAHSY